MSIDEKEIYIRPCGGKKDFTFDMFYEENGFNKKDPQVNDPFSIGCSYKRSNKSSNNLLWWRNPEFAGKRRVEFDSYNDSRKLYRFRNC